MELNIIGIGTGQISYVEYNSHSVMDDFELYANKIKNIYTTVKSSILGGGTPSASNYDLLIAAVNQMAELAKNGRVDTNGETNYQSYMTADMAKVLSTVTETFAAAGIVANSTENLTSSQKIDRLINLVSQGASTNLAVNIDNLSQYVEKLKNYTVQVKKDGTGALTNLEVQGSPTRTLQSMLGLEYVATGNGVMATHMSDLEQALSLSKSALTSLQILQGISNQISSPSVGQFNFPPTFNGVTANYTGLNSTFPDPTITAIMTSAALQRELLDVPSSLVGFTSNSSTNYFAQAIKDAYNSTDDAGKKLLTDAFATNGHFTPNADFLQTGLNKLINYNNVDFVHVSNALARFPAIAVALVNDAQSRQGLGTYITNIINGGDISKTKSLYRQMASAYFTQLFPTASPLADSATLLLKTKGQLEVQLNKILAVSSETSKTKEDTDAATDLTGALRKVLNDISAAFSGVDLTNNDAIMNATRNWILDNQDKRIGSDGSQQNAGAIQANLQTAITNGQTLEERQRESVRKYLFVFQEFYKSASAMLQTISDMLTKITNKLSN